MKSRIVIAAAVLAAAAVACGGSDTPAGTDGGADNAVEAGRAVYRGSCRACHGSDGEGVDGLGKPLVDSEFVDGLDDAALAAFIAEGRPADHPDNTTGMEMPPKGNNSSLTDEDLANVVAYIRSLQ
ncbi:MAG TPA: cytochrome c [Acidimicrobiia bacterium]